MTRRPPRPIRVGTRRAPSPLALALALAVALLVAGVPVAAAGAAADAIDAGPGLASGQTVLLLAAPSSGVPATGAAGRAFAAAPVVPIVRPRPGRSIGRGRRAAVRRGTAQRWYALRRMDGG